MIGQGGCLWSLDPAVEYEGPLVDRATLGGTPTWGLGDRFHEAAEALGHTRLGVYRPNTPYGLGPRVEHFQTPGGQEFIRIPSYGQVVDEDPLLRASEWKTFWILWKAGVRIVLVGGTSGSCDWRRSAVHEDAVQPGDLVLPWSYLPNDTMPTGLPGTELEHCVSRQVAIMDDPFCHPLADELKWEAESLADYQFRAIHDRDAEVVLHRWSGGNGFGSLAQSRMLEELGRQMGMPIITGDCVSPVLARVCGMHMLYYHVVSNWATGLFHTDPTFTLDALYLKTLPKIASELELNLLDRLEEPTNCKCRALLRPRPPEYALALSPRPVVE